MSTKLIPTLSALAMVLGGLSAHAQDAAAQGGAVAAPASVPREAPAKKALPAKPQYDLRQKNLVSGGRVTLFANFLRKEAGVVLFVHHETSQECALVEWRPDSVTVDLPKLRLAEPQKVEILILLPDGRVAKTFHLICEPQPELLVHSDSIPRPTAPVEAEHASYVK